MALPLGALLYRARRARLERLIRSAFAGLIAAQHDLGAIAVSETSLTPMTMLAGARLAISSDVPLTAGDVTILVGDRQEFTHPDLAADEIYRGIYAELGHIINVERGATAPAGTLTIYVIDGFGRHLAVATATFSA